MPTDIQCSTGPFWPFELEVAFDTVAEAGFRDIELMVTRDPKTQDAEIAGDLARERGLRIRAVHGPFLVITKSVWGLDPIEKVRRGIEMCRAVGADVYIVHPPYLWEREFAGWIAAEQEVVQQETGVKVAVETMYPKWVAGRRFRAHRWLDPRELAAESRWTVLDTSHLSVARKDILRAFDVLAPGLVHVHLSNNAGDGRDGHLQLEKGILPLDRFLAELRRTKYAGAVSLELSVVRYVERPADMARMLRRSREWTEAHLAPRARVTKGLPRS
jgi:sugar phosphate isomerase/epimerase